MTGSGWRRQWAGASCGASARRRGSDWPDGSGPQDRLLVFVHGYAAPPSLFVDRLDLIVEKATVTDEKVSKDDLLKEDDMPEGYSA